MKVLISADLEGVSGVCHPDQIYPNGKSYKETLIRWSKELNAITAGLKESGIKEIVINDSHNHMRNLDNSLVPEVEVVSGWQRPFSMVSGIEKNFDAVFFTGYHAMAGSKSTLSHTYRPRIIKQVLLNKIPVGEVGLNAALAGHFNVPVVFVSGDEETCFEAQNLLESQIITVQTKKGLSRYSALSYPFETNLLNLKEGAIKAIKEKVKWKVFKINSPTTITITFAETNHADSCELIPNVKRISDNQVEFTDKDYSIVFKCFLAMGVLAASRDEVIT
ncbi:MAG: M55 family metallopeptidase [Candidatus Melainabacteria bacterium]|nr:M55 family metallopeptidase [Candidatus Melainabacteria bacterium]